MHITRIHPFSKPAARILATAALALGLGACSSLGGTASSAALSPARIAEIVASPDRSDADRRNDERRKPQQMLAFIGIHPGMVALDLSAGGGYTTELLARAIGPSGRVYGQVPPPPKAAARPSESESGGAVPPATTAVAVPRAPTAALTERAKNPNAANIVAVVQPFENPVPAELASNGLDVVTLMFNYHDLGWRGADRAQMNRAVFAALKPGGVYVIADHAGRAGTGISESGTLHRIEESFLRSEVEKAGFRLAATGDFLRNPADPRDRNTPNPPQPKDEFVLKFVKP